MVFAPGLFPGRAELDEDDDVGDDCGHDGDDGGALQPVVSQITQVLQVSTHRLLEHADLLADPGRLPVQPQQRAAGGSGKVQHILAGFAGHHDQKHDCLAACWTEQGQVRQQSTSFG